MARKAKPIENQPLLFQPEWVPPKLDELPNWNDGKRICIDVETRDDQLTTLGPGVRRGAYITSVQFAIEDGPSYFLPIRFGGGDNLDPTKVMAYIKEQTDKFTGTIVGANLQYDLDHLGQEGITFPETKWFRDIQVAGPILDEYMHSYALAALAKHYELPGKDDTDLKEACRAHGIKVIKNSRKWMGEVWKLPARYVKDYGIQDVLLPLQILRMQERQIDHQNLWQIYDLESKVLPVLLKMRRKGVRIDTAKLQKIEDHSVQQETEALEQLHQHTGVRVKVGDVWQTDPLVEALGTQGIEVPKTIDKKTGEKTDTDSVAAEFLSGLDNPVADCILSARRANKTRTTFVSLVREHMINGRVHCTFNQLRKTKDDGALVGTITGRLSSSNPNMQFQPSKGMWREIYVPDEGKQWCSCDYSQQEFRLVVSYAVKANCRGAIAAAQAYHDDPDIDSHQAVANLVGISRSPAKTINFGVIYGMGGGKMCNKLDLPTEMRPYKYGKEGEYEAAGPEGQALLDKFHEKAPYLMQLSKKAQRRAEQAGFVITLLGRKCRFPAKNGRRDWTHKALNKVIQGSAADQTKQAMVDVDAALPDFLQLQIHDELDGSISCIEEAHEVARIMRDCCPIEVPVKVDIEIGPSWGEARPI